MAAWVPRMICKFYVAKNDRIANNSITTEVNKNKHGFGIVINNKGFSKFKNNKILLHKIRQKFLVTFQAIYRVKHPPYFEITV